MGKFTDKLHHMKTTTTNYPNDNVNWLMNSINKPTKKFMKLSLQHLKIGSFYFVRYDMTKINKSSKMEQLVPLMVVDYKEKIDSKVVWILNLNFLTMKTKELFFTNFLDRYDKVFETNSNKTDWLSEQPIPNVSYDKMYSELLRYGVEYSLREMRVELFNEIYSVSTDEVEKLISVNTQALTGVDEGKLEEIWIAKLKSENLESRIADIMTIKNNYEKIVEELAEKFKHLNKRIQE